MNHSNTQKLVLTIIISLLALHSLSATTYTYIGGSSNNYISNINWLDGLKPSNPIPAGDTVIIETGTECNIDVTVSSYGTFINRGFLNSDGSLFSHDTLINEGTITGSITISDGVMINYGLVTASFLNFAKIENHKTWKINLPCYNQEGALIENYDSLIFEPSAFFENKVSAMVINMNLSSIYSNTINATIINDGYIHNDGGGSFKWLGKIINRGTVHNSWEMILENSGFPSIGFDNYGLLTNDFFGPIVNNGYLTNRSTGKIYLNDDLVNALPMINNNGSITGLGPITNDVHANSGAVVNPGIDASPGPLRINGNYYQDQEAELVIEIEDHLKYDNFHVNQAYLGGTLTFVIDENYTIKGCEYFNILKYSAREGQFELINLPDISPLEWDLKYHNNYMSLGIKQEGDNCLSFDGIDDHLTKLSGASGLLGTIEFRFSPVKVDPAFPGDPLFSFSSFGSTSNDWIKTMDATPEISGETLTFQTISLDGSKKYLYTDYPFTNEWHHVAIQSPTLSTYSQIFVNGLPVNTYTFDGYPAVLFPNRIDIGKEESDYYQGKLDEIRIWSSRRGYQDILNFHDVEISSDSEGLFFYHNLNQGVANGGNSGLECISNLTGGNVHFVLNGFALQGDFSNWVFARCTEHPINEFIGSVNSLWNEPQNWSQGRIPLRCDNVSIGPSHTVEIQASDDISCHVLQLHSTAALNLAPTATVHLYGDK